VHLLPQSGDVSDLVMPSKLGGMMASGRPVIATAHPETQIAEVVNGRGLVTRPGDVKEFADALVTLAGDASLRTQLGEEARSYAIRHLSKEVALKDFEKELIAAGR
jgi:colanic acid biosynthesis glycosyl transferase WcaI